MSSVPKREFKAEYYDEDYFRTPEGKKFDRGNGTLGAWSYANPMGEFLGAKDVAEAWNEIFKPKNMLDVGAGRGTFIAYARDFGIWAEGFDYSEWAVSDEGRYPRCDPGWLRLYDATRPWPYKNRSFDLVVSLDFYEHIYEDDLEMVIGEMYRVAKKWIFLQIATVDGVREKGYILKKGKPVPKGLEMLAVAGHVTVCPEEWWLDRFEHDDWMLRRDMVEWFCGLVDPAIIRNWLLNTIIVLERI